MCGDEARLRVVQDDPQGRYQPVYMGRAAERRQVEQEFEVVSPGEAAEGHGSERDHDDGVESLARQDLCVHGPTLIRRPQLLNERLLKSGLLLYDHAQVTDETQFHFDGWALH